METMSLDISSLGEKVEQQIITLVDTSHLDDTEMAENSAPLVHHVLEPREIQYTRTENGQNTHCLICNAKMGVSARGAIHIFSNQVKTNSRHLDLLVVLNTIIKGELNASNVHSSILCRKCFKLIDDIDSVEEQLVNMKQEVNSKFHRTQELVQLEKNEFVPICNGSPGKMANDDTEFKIMSKVRGKRGRRGRGRGRPPPFLKLEVKEESDDVLTCLEFTDSNHSNQDEFQGLEEHQGLDNVKSISVSEETSEEIRIEVEDVLEVDGLDLDNEDNTIQIGGMVVPTVSSEMVKREEFCQDEDLVENRLGRYRCRFCQTRMHTFSQIQDHLLQFHSDRLFECEVCKERLDSQSELLGHLEQHMASGDKPFSCRFCSRRYSLPRLLKEHLRHHLNKKVPCYQCSKRFRTEAALQEHMNTHTGCRPYACDQCHKRFTSKHILKNHLRTHGARNRPHKCKVCQKHFLMAHHLSDHMQIHQNRKDFICETCGKAFSTQRSLDLHFVTHSGIKNYVCRICFKAFARKGEVEDHERIHTGEKPFQCEICGATFSQRSNLQSHKRATHYEEKKYRCNECNKAFKRRRLLVYHVMSVHTGERPFKCDFCAAAFVYPEHYKKHLRIHTGEKPFKCEICGKAFNSRDNKNAHKFIHSEKKQYECVLCGMGFMRKPHLMTHIAQHERSGNIESYIKVNSSSIVDAELSEARAMRGSMILKGDDEQSIDQNNLEDHMQLVRAGDETENVVIPRPIQIVDADDVQRYFIHKTGDKSDDAVGHFLASLQGQVVEVRADDLERYTELTVDQLSQMAQVAAQVVATQSNGSPQIQQDSGDYRLLQIQLEEQKDGQQAEGILSTEANVITTSTNSKIDSRQFQGALFKKPTLTPQVGVGSGRQVRSWLSSQTEDDFVDNS